jgi:dTDP-4-amino-4,6-dideoxygalactose transaminase
MMIPYEDLRKVNEPYYSEIEKSFRAVFASGWYILGEEVRKFEEEFAAYCGAKHCIGLNSGLDALTISLTALDLPPGSEVLVPSNTYIATILSIVQNGLTPVLVEPDIDTYNIDPKKIEQAISSKTKAIMIVHLYGRICDMKAIKGLSEHYGLKLIEDCAQSHGAALDGKRCGTFGEAGAFSFYPTKNLGALGDAGAIVTDDGVLADRMRSLRNYGSKKKYFNDVVGLNSRLDELQASFLSKKLKHLDDINKHKRTLAGLYEKHLPNRFIKPTTIAPEQHVYHIYNIRHQNRDKLKSWLLDRGVGTEIHYPLAPHLQVAMKGKFTGKYPISELIHETTLSLPISSCHTVADVEKVIAIMSDFPE